MSASRDHDGHLTLDGARMSGQHYYRHEGDGRRHYDEHYYHQHGCGDEHYLPNVKSSGDHHDGVVLLIDSYIRINEAKRASVCAGM